MLQGILAWPHSSRPSNWKKANQENHNHIRVSNARYREEEYSRSVTMEDQFGGLFSIDIDSDACVQEYEKVPRDFQSEEDFLQQRKAWTPKNEVGEVGLWTLCSSLKIEN